ncbi:MAG: hypothetical protein KDI51_20060 [Xanthomonadales bacterium]|nr:hypothetical protein [Xanthomonadales bacterium]
MFRTADKCVFVSFHLEAFLIVQTPIGALGLSVTAGGKHLGSADFRAVSIPASPHLPPGMSVESVTAVVVWMHPRSPLHSVNLVLGWLQPVGAGSPESGQYLDAQSWQVGEHIVYVGTEDVEALFSRISGPELTEEDCLVVYRAHGLEVRLQCVPSGRETSLHFVVAVNSWPEPVECSAWFAVDIAHEELLSAAVET